MQACAVQDVAVTDDTHRNISVLAVDGNNGMDSNGKSTDNNVSSVAFSKEKEPVSASKIQKGPEGGMLIDVVPGEVLWSARTPPPPEAQRRGSRQGTPKTPRTPKTSIISCTGATAELSPFSPTPRYSGGFMHSVDNGTGGILCGSSPERSRSVGWDRDVESAVGINGDEIGNALLLVPTSAKSEKRRLFASEMLHRNSHDARPPISLLEDDESHVARKEGTGEDGKGCRCDSCSTERWTAAGILERVSALEISIRRVEQQALGFAHGENTLVRGSTTRARSLDVGPTAQIERGESTGTGRGRKTLSTDSANTLIDIFT